MSLEEVQLCCEELKASRNGPRKDRTDQQAAHILPILRRLSKQTLDTKNLRSTGVGKEVNDAFFRNHPDVKVREACAALINKWKAIAFGRPEPAAPGVVSETPAPVAASSTAPSKEKRKSEKTTGKVEKAKRSKTEKAEVGPEGPNQELCSQFKELAAHEFKKGGSSKFAGIAFNKVVAVLQTLDYKVTSGDSIAHMKGIGKESVKKIDQYLEKGIIDKLERIRNGFGDIAFNQLERCQASRTAVAAVAGVAAVAMVCGPASTAQIPHASQASATTRSPVQKLKTHELLAEIQSLLTNSAPNLRECMVALNALGQRKLWRESISLMESMAFRRVQPDQFLFNKLISICAKSKEGLPAWNLLGSMRQRRLFPDVLACNMVINALASSGLWEKVLGVSVNSAISACAQGSRWMQAIQFLDEGQRLSIAPDVTTYGATMQACETQWKLVLHLLDEMQNKTIQPNEIISAATVRACAKGSPELSTELFASLKEKGIRQNKFSYSAAIGACHVDQYLWPWSLWYLQEMKTDGIEIDIGIMNGVMSACQEAHQWGHLQKRDIRLVEQLLDDVKYLQLVPDIITYSHVMAAARKAGDWERVLWSIQNLRPDGALYTHAISACAKGWRWQHALGLLATANAGGSLEYHWSSAMAACADSTQWEHAIALAPQMQELGLQPEVVTYTALACAYVQGGHWPVAFELLAMMQDNGEEPNHIMLTSVIRSCMPRRNFALAVNWKAQMEKIGVQPYLTTYVCLIALAAEAQQWKWVQYLLAESNVRYPMAENFDIRQAEQLTRAECIHPSVMNVS
eukprot:symbB.v1.2.000329.t1/scaffold6.1/size569917/32